MTDVPRIYVVCLAAYNNGRLHGAWINADQPPEQIWSDVHRMLAASPESGAEEWAIQDYEGFGDLRLSEWESFDRISVIAAAIAEHGSTFIDWLVRNPNCDLASHQAFKDS